jgi:pyrimidine operon attenuation protein/uracil phosphoribosyltransferase
LLKKAEIMDENAVARAITRISYEILERNGGAENICVIGILSRGAVLAQRIADKISELEKTKVPIGILDITHYRDDIDEVIESEKTDIDFDVKDKRVILIDDVMFTGRSTRAALDAIISRGRPQSIQLAVLIDRGHRELPMRPDYVGKNVPTAKNEIVKVQVKEMDNADCVTIYTM